MSAPGLTPAVPTQQAEQAKLTEQAEQPNQIVEGKSHRSTPSEPQRQGDVLAQITAVTAATRKVYI